ncbi:hypothetical protein EUX98_g8366 [Antrodiella citrinella]|uniref:Uncharacterized protein n=1 Tax=Antrodiella citrinella TaxID=2447956 RepID=A0A4S4M8Q5_9APHY|nr:hypothetical protein EUX98_g8366 [Antrodiella citrinella]
MVSTRSGLKAPLPSPPPLKPRKARKKILPVPATLGGARAAEDAGNQPPVILPVPAAGEVQGDGEGAGERLAANSGPLGDDHEDETGDNGLHGSAGHLDVRQDPDRDTRVDNSKAAGNASNPADPGTGVGGSFSPTRRSDNASSPSKSPPNMGANEEASLRRSSRVPVPSEKIREYQKPPRSVSPAVSADESSVEGDDFVMTLLKESPAASDSEDDLASDGEPEDAETLDLITTRKGKGRATQGGGKKMKAKKELRKQKHDAKGKGKAVINDNEERGATEVKKGKERMLDPLPAADSHSLPVPNTKGRASRPKPVSDAQLETDIVAEIEQIVREASDSAEGMVFEKPSRGALSADARARCEHVRDKLDELLSAWSRIHKKGPELFAQHMGLTLKGFSSRGSNTKLWDLFQFKYSRDFPDVAYDAKEASDAFAELQDEQEDWSEEEVDAYWNKIRIEFDATRKNAPDGGKESSGVLRARLEEFGNTMTKMANTFGRVYGSHVLGVVLHVPIDNGPHYFQVFGNTSETRALLNANQDLVDMFIGYLRVAIGAFKLLQMGWHLTPFLNTILRWSARHPVPQPRVLESGPPGGATEKQGHGKTKGKGKAKAQHTNSGNEGSDEEDDEDAPGTGAASDEKKESSVERKRSLFRTQTFVRYREAVKATGLGWVEGKTQFPGAAFLDVAVKYGIRCTNVPLGRVNWTWPGPHYDRKKVPYNLIGIGQGWEFERLTEGEMSYRKTSKAWADVPLVVNANGAVLWRVRDSMTWRKATSSGASDPNPEPHRDPGGGDKRKHAVESNDSESGRKKMKHDADEEHRSSVPPEPMRTRRPDPDSHAQAGPSRVAGATFDWEMYDDSPPSPLVHPSDPRPPSPAAPQAVPANVSVESLREARQKAAKLRTAKTVLRQASDNYSALCEEMKALNNEMDLWTAELAHLVEDSDAWIAHRVIGEELSNEVESLGVQLQSRKNARIAALKAVALLEGVGQ